MRRTSNPSTPIVSGQLPHNDHSQLRTGLSCKSEAAAAPAPTPLMVRGISAGCRLTGLGERSIWLLVNRNALPHRRVGRAILFVPDEIAAWIRLGCPTEAGAADRVRKAVAS